VASSTTRCLLWEKPDVSSLSNLGQTVLSPIVAHSTTVLYRAFGDVRRDRSSYRNVVVIREDLPQCLAS